MRPGWLALLISITGVLLVVAWSRNETPEFQQQLTIILAAVIAILIAVIVWIAQVNAMLTRDAPHLAIA